MIILIYTVTDEIVSRKEYNNNEAPLVRGLTADGMISVCRDGWTILNKYTGFITYIGVVSTVSPMIEKNTVIEELLKIIIQ